MAETTKTGQSGQDIETQSKPAFTYETAHLPQFDDLKRMSALHGSGYIVPLKAIYYANIGAAIGPHTIEIGDIKTDSRESTDIVMGSGRGKLNLVQLLKAPKRCGAKVASPTSYHPEQLVGKMVMRAKKVKGKIATVLVPNPGYLYDDILIFEEALTLIKSTQQEEKECRGYISRAQDRIPENYVTKRQVDQLRGEGLEYVPTVQIHYVMQPIPIDEEVFQQGLMRRPFIIYPKLLSGEDRAQEFNERIDGVGDEVKNAESKYIAFLSSLKKRTVGGFSPACRERLLACHTELYRFGRSTSPKSAAYTEAAANTLMDHLVKMSALLAWARDHNRVEEEDVLFAYGDLMEIFETSLNYVEDCVIGEVAYRTVREPNQKESDVLFYLKDKIAISLEDSNVGIAEIQKTIAEIYQFKGEPKDVLRQARRIYAGMKRKGFVADRKGKHDSVVWLLREPTAFKPAVCDFSEYVQYQEAVRSVHSQKTREKGMDTGIIGKICKYERKKLAEIVLRGGEDDD